MSEDKAIELKADYFEAITYKNLLLRLQAQRREEPGPAAGAAARSRPRSATRPRSCARSSRRRRRRIAPLSPTALRICPPPGGRPAIPRDGPFCRLARPALFRYPSETAVWYRLGFIFRTDDTRIEERNGNEAPEEGVVRGARHGTGAGPACAGARPIAGHHRRNQRTRRRRAGRRPARRHRDRHGAQTGLVRTVVTNEEGVFALPLLPTGTYEVTAELSRLCHVQAGGAARPSARPSRSTRRFRWPACQEQVTVTAAAPIVETSATVRTTTVDQEAIQNLPINGRRFQDFITLTPTVQVDTSRGQLSFAGQRGINANVSIDGADYNQPFFGGIRGGERSNTAFTIPQEAIKEFQVVASGYSAEFGRSTGGLVNAITKSGTNAPAGIALLREPQQGVGRAERLRPERAAPTQQQFGGSIGGPIARNRLFYFVAGEMQRLKNTRNVVFALTGITPNADNQRGLQLLQGARRAVRRDQRRRSDPRPCRLSDGWRQPPRGPLQLQQQRGGQLERHRQRALRHDDQRRVQQRHREGSDEHRRRRVHLGAARRTC